MNKGYIVKQITSVALGGQLCLGTMDTTVVQSLEYVGVRVLCTSSCQSLFKGCLGDAGSERWCGSLCIYLTWSSLRLLEVWINAFREIWEVFNHFFSIFLLLSLSPLLMLLPLMFAHLIMSHISLPLCSFFIFSLCS